MKTILVVVKDFENTENYLKYVLGLAKDLAANVLLFYAEEPFKYPLGAAGMEGRAYAELQASLEARIKTARETLSNQVSALVAKVAGISIVEVKTAIGNKESLINEMVNSGQVQMVMMQGPSKDSFIQDITEATSLFRSVNWPVWIIPEKCKYQIIESIIYATDYQEEDISTLSKLISHTYFLSPKITALHITETPDFELRVKNAGFSKMLESKLSYNDISVKALVEKEGNDVAQMIESYASRIKADLIVMLKENKGFLERIFNPSSADKIMKESSLPVLIYHSAN
ncbi:MAG: universal stress protein [Anaerolineales bacterium]|nr:universal stress protein [Anaerolineales bacterium]